MRKEVREKREGEREVSVEGREISVGRREGARKGGRERARKGGKEGARGGGREGGREQGREGGREEGHKQYQGPGRLAPQRGIDSPVHPIQ